MSVNSLIKRVLWVALFIAVLFGLYKLFQGLGVGI